MYSPEAINTNYWTEEIRKLSSRVTELESYISDSQNAVTSEGEDTSEAMADAEVELEQVKTNLTQAKLELAKLRRKEKIADLMPRTEELRTQIEMHKKVDTREARELEEILEQLEAVIKELEESPVSEEEMMSIDNFST